VSGRKEIWAQIKEMGQIKSDFDTEKYTVAHEGNFIANQFHFLMRQYRFALEEIERWEIELERIERGLKAYSAIIENPLASARYSGELRAALEKESHPDLKIRELELRKRSLEIDLWGKKQTVKHFEKMRLALIEMNGGKPYTNEQYQEEQAAYWHWFLSSRARYQMLSRATGISEGVLMNFDHASRRPVLEDSKHVTPPVFTPDGQAIFLGEIFKSGVLPEDGTIEIEKAPDPPKITGPGPELFRSLGEAGLLQERKI